MQRPDALTGWDDELNAELYDRFTREHTFYTDASRDLAARADLTDKQLVIDLCGGTGATAAVLLDNLPPHGRVISLDNAAAMQAVGRRHRDHPRIAWITAQAEDLADHVSTPADAVICNSAIWKTNTTAVFAAAHRVLRPGGRFVFNIGGRFAGLTDRELHTMASLNDLIVAIAVADYGYIPPQQKRRPSFTAAVLRTQLTAAGFATITTDVVTRIGTLEEKRAWLSIPLFARPPGQLTHTQRMNILHKAYEQVDKTRQVTTRWLVVTAQA
ncbi:methyltransferase domain-containing protein [Nonomuraea phyllanthi]|uniref:class I SAM-dependent methyltransferase n=1 Tax=Nonomuraea phyllanthi TaxID=2219224 RepID=UPI001293EAF6|nr:class I SAM-dependent methyltransferase [Nonomuraea phyllanthi]QFY07943.1 methyltransferase domain-containing protein [Nonomuraea phyllanthi]